MLNSYASGGSAKVNNSIKIKEMLDNEPTAYDVENVVQKIRELDSCDSCYNQGREDCSWCTVKERIDIISNNK